MIARQAVRQIQLWSPGAFVPEELSRHPMVPSVENLQCAMCTHGVLGVVKFSALEVAMSNLAQLS